MKRFLCLPLVAAGLTLAAGRAGAQTRVRVVANRVNLRAGPAPSAEVVALVDKGVLLSAGATNDEWLAVTPPASADLCIHAELVKDGVVSASKAMVRGGPGINYRALGTLQRGDAVNVRGAVGDWLKIEPPPGCLLWISRQYVQPLEAPVEGVKPPVRLQPAGATPATPPPPARPRPEEMPVPRPPMPEIGQAPKPAACTPPAVAPVETREPAPSPLLRQTPERERWAAWLDPKTLAPSKTQGQEVTVSGVLRRAFIVWRRPSRFCLVNYNANGVAVMSCYVVANQSRLAGLKGRHMTVYGRQYWVQGVRQPVVVPERILRNDR